MLWFTSPPQPFKRPQSHACEQPGGIGRGCCLPWCPDWLHRAYLAARQRLGACCIHPITNVLNALRGANPLRLLPPGAGEGRGLAGMAQHRRRGIESDVRRCGRGGVQASAPRQRAAPHRGVEGEHREVLQDVVLHGAHVRGAHPVLGGGPDEALRAGPPHRHPAPPRRAPALRHCRVAATPHTLHGTTRGSGPRRAGGQGAPLQCGAGAAAEEVCGGEGSPELSPRSSHRRCPREGGCTHWTDAPGCCWRCPAAKARCVTIPHRAADEEVQRALGSQRAGRRLVRAPGERVVQRH